MATKNRTAQKTTLVDTNNIRSLDDIINNLDQLIKLPDFSLPVSLQPMSWIQPEEIKPDPKFIKDFANKLADRIVAHNIKSATATVPTAVASTQDAILQFLESKKAASLRPSSLKNYAQVLRWFAAKHANLPCTNQQMQAFLASRVWADTTRLLVYKVLKDFSKFVAERFGIMDAMAGIPKPRVRQKEPDCLTLSKVKLLLNAIETPRERALVYLCLGQALRISEAVSLTISDIGEDLLRIKEGKEREESMPLLPEVRDALRELDGNRNWNEPVFVGSNGHLGRDTGEHIIKRVFQRAGINGIKQSPHTLRHTFATLATNDGCDEYSLGRLLRHAKSNWNITHRYIHLGMSDLRAKLERYSPIRLVVRQNGNSDKLLEGQGL